MLLEDLREKIQALAAAIAADAALTVDDVSLARGRRGWQIRVTLDRADGYVGVDECGVVNERLRVRLALENLLEGDFALEVSSPGLDRPLRAEGDFRRFRGFLARLTVRGGGVPGGVLEGRIIDVGGGSVVVDTGAGTVAVPLAELKEARLEPELPGFAKEKGNPKRERAARRRRGSR